MLVADPDTGTHAECYCSSCRAAEVFVGQPDPAPDPVGIFQTSADALRIDGGHDHLSVFSFGETNLLRWYASCCGTPMFNTMRNPKMGFVGIRTTCLADTEALGPVLGTGFITADDGKQTHRGLRLIVWRMFKRIARSRLTGSWAKSPLFDKATRKPVKPVKVVTAAERRALIKAF
ncbi:GFA domain containing protein [Sulfitobacter noctilucae]|nr:GFA domain containing protein [Sulfitobacter noctilucae]